MHHNEMENLNDHFLQSKKVYLVRVSKTIGVVVHWKPQTSCPDNEIKRLKDDYDSYEEKTIKMMKIFRFDECSK